VLLTERAGQVSWVVRRRNPLCHRKHQSLTSCPRFATRRGIDDVLFRHRDDPDRFTVVHLSWLGRTEINAQHPTVEFDGSFSEFLADEARITAFLQEQARKRDPRVGVPIATEKKTTN